VACDTLGALVRPLFGTSEVEIFSGVPGTVNLIQIYSIHRSKEPTGSHPFFYFSTTNCYRYWDTIQHHAATVKRINNTFYLYIPILERWTSGSELSMIDRVYPDPSLDLAISTDEISASTKFKVRLR